MSDAALDTLLASAARPYFALGRFAGHSAHGKLRFDPLFGALLRRGLLPQRGRWLDLGCGVGLVAALVAAARTAHSEGVWPTDWPPPPSFESYRGVDLGERRIAVAARALGNAAPPLDTAARFEVGDIATTEFGAVDAVLVFDVLHYLPADAQQRVLERIVAALAADGMLLLRVGDAAAGLRALATRAFDRVAAVVHGHPQLRLRTRPVADWAALLAQLGLEVESLPMSTGTPFANVLLVARAPAAGSSR